MLDLSAVKRQIDVMVSERVGAAPEEEFRRSLEMGLAELDRWSGRGEELGVWTADGRLVDRIDWEEGESDPGTSYARIPDRTGDFLSVETPTPGAPNVLLTAILGPREDLPQTLQLRGNWPNPFNASTVIAFDLPAAQPVRLVVYDSLGRLVRVLYDQPLAAGSYRTRWDGLDAEGRPAASGPYLYRLAVGRSFRAVGRMMLVR